MNKAYKAGYMQKEADVSDILAWLADKGLWSALAIPGVIGAGVGTLHSKMTSPGKLDEELMYKKMLASELQEQLALMRRKRELSKKDTDSTTDRSRSIHI